jgi:hypothetical protein
MFGALGDDAEKARMRLFGDGLEFVNWKVEKEWAIVHSKIAIIDTQEEGILPILQSLGAMPILEHLRKVHATYGNTIGTTQVPEESPAVREKRDALLESMRIYVVRVSASVEPDDPGTKERADALLRPLMQWRGNPSAPRPVPGESEAVSTTDTGPGISDKPAGT